jgi:hypothetical protein
LSFDAERLFNLLPAFYRIRDIAVAEQLAALLGLSDEAAQWAGLLTTQEEAERRQLRALRQSLFAAHQPFPVKEAARLEELEDKRQRGPLKAMLAVVAEQVAVLEEDLAQLYDDQFIETCAEWVVPYIGDLVGTRGLFYYSNTRKLSQRAQVANTLAYRRRKGTASVLEQLARDVTEWDASVVEYFQRLATTQYLNHLRPENLSFSGIRHRHFAGLQARLSAEEAGERDERQWLAIEYANTPTDKEPCDPHHRGTCWRGQSPFDTLARTADVRSIESRRGKYNIPNVGIFLWRLGSYSVTDAPAYRVPDTGDPLTDGRRFLFNAAGLETALYNRPITEDEITHLSEPVNVPAPFTRRVLDRFLEAFYGEDTTQLDTGKSLLVNLNGADVVGAEPPPPDLRELLCVCDLSDRLDEVGNVVKPWARHPTDRIALDPVLGRLAFPKNDAPPRSVRVHYHYGFGAEMGGGEYGRAQTFGDLARVIEVAKQTSLDTIFKGLNELPPLFAADPQFVGGVVEVTDNDYYAEPLNVHVPARKKIEVRAADERRPTVVIDGDAILRGGRDAELTINGLLVASGTLFVPPMINNNLRLLTLRHCTLVPGASPAFPAFGMLARAAAPKLVIQIPGVQVEIDSCILGPILVHQDSQVKITNSIVDATDETGVAYAAPNGAGAGGALEIENCTVVGRVHTKRIEASNTIFLAGFAGGVLWPSPVTPPNAPVLAERVQEGCVRFSYVPPGSRIPRPFRCQPAGATDDAHVRPTLTSLRYGEAAYCQLSRYSAVEIREGADDGAEMGAFHDLYQPQRVANLRARLDEYLRFGLEAGIFFAS